MPFWVHPSPDASLLTVSRPAGLASFNQTFLPLLFCLTDFQPFCVFTSWLDLQSDRRPSLLLPIPQVQEPNSKPEILCPTGLTHSGSSQNLTSHMRCTRPLPASRAQLEPEAFQDPEMTALHTTVYALFTFCFCFCFFT